MASRRSSTSSDSGEISNRLSELRVSNGYDVSPIEKTGFFSPLSLSAQRHLKSTARKIRKDLTTTQAGLDSEGIIYVAKDMNSSYVKVGFSKKEKDARVKNITERCKILVEKSYMTRKFLSAHRGEQIIHSLLENEAHVRLKCACGKDNREWYKKSFESTITQVSIVYAWMSQEPYDQTTRQLKTEWKRALEILVQSLDTKSPLTWAEFFLMGLSLQPPPKTPRPWPPPHNLSSPVLAQFTDAASPTPMSRMWRQSERHGSRQPQLLHADSSPASFRGSNASNWMQDRRASASPGWQSTLGVYGHPKKMEPLQGPGLLSNESLAKTLAKTLASKEPLISRQKPFIGIVDGQTSEDACSENEGDEDNEDDDEYQDEDENDEEEEEEGEEEEEEEEEGEEEEEEGEGEEEEVEEEEEEEEEEEAQIYGCKKPSVDETYGDESVEDRLLAEQQDEKPSENEESPRNEEQVDTRGEVFPDDGDVLDTSSEDKEPAEGLDQGLEQCVREDESLQRHDNTLESLSQAMGQLELAEQEHTVPVENNKLPEQDGSLRDEESDGEDWETTSSELENSNEQLEELVHQNKELRGQETTLEGLQQALVGLGLAEGEHSKLVEDDGSPREGPPEEDVTREQTRIRKHTENGSGVQPLEELIIGNKPSETLAFLHSITPGAQLPPRASCLLPVFKPTDWLGEAWGEVFAVGDSSASFKPTVKFERYRTSQGLTFQEPNYIYSPEELRLADYNAHRCFGNNASSAVRDRVVDTEKDQHILEDPLPEENASTEDAHPRCEEPVPNEAAEYSEGEESRHVLDERVNYVLQPNRSSYWHRRQTWSQPNTSTDFFLGQYGGKWHPLAQMALRNSRFEIGAIDTDMASMTLLSSSLEGCTSMSSTKTWLVSHAKIL